jgi:hypothetical protein
LFNDIKSVSLGRRKRNGTGTHFQWDKAAVNYNILYAEGRVNGKVVATDYVVLNHLAESPNFKSLKPGRTSLLNPAKGYKYIYRVNCGGPDYTDENGNLWMSDGKALAGRWGSKSWTDEFNLPAFYASQRSTNDPVKGTKEWPLFQNFRYGMDKLEYEFPVKDGNYLVDLYFTEPWYGTGGGMDCTGWRLFDVAINGKTLIKDLDIWKEAGHDAALKKTVSANVTGGKLTISFPHVAAGEAIVSAIAIASVSQNITPASGPQKLISQLTIDNKEASAKTFLNTAYKPFADDTATYAMLPAELYGAEWVQPVLKAPMKTLQCKLTNEADVYIAIPSSISAKPGWLTSWANANKFIVTGKNGGERYALYTKRFLTGADVIINQPVTAGKEAVPFLLFANPVSGIEPPYDLKPTIRSEAEKAVLLNAQVAKDSFAGKAYVQMKKANDAVEWSFSPGVADMYSLHFRYINPSTKPVEMQMKILAADGTVMKEEVLQLPPTTTKWATVDSNTGSYINAGNYKIVLSSVTSESIGIDYLEIQ